MEMYSAANTLAIRTVGLSRDFGEVRALSDLTLDVQKGIVFGFLGPNGAGKTTTIRLLLGLLPPTAGHAEVLGLDPHLRGVEVRARTGALLEHAGLYERLSAKDNLDFHARIWRMSDVDRRARVQELLTQLGLWDRRDDQVGAWSRGMKQKLAVARALLHRPSLVFLDEPTAGLDPIAAAALREDLRELASREGVTVFLTTHNLAEAEKLCERVGVIRGGRLVAVGHPDELRARTAGPRVEIVAREVTDAALAGVRDLPEVRDVSAVNGKLFVDLNGEASASNVVARLVQAGAQIEEVRRSKASLEEVFLSLMEESPANV
jgi:ABC-2 type transport system ATP-binding protein